MPNDVDHVLSAALLRQLADTLDVPVSAFCGEGPLSPSDLREIEQALVRLGRTLPEGIDPALRARCTAILEGLRARLSQASARPSGG